MHCPQLWRSRVPLNGMLHRLERRALPSACSTKRDAPTSDTLLSFRQHDLQELVGWEVCLQRSRTSIGSVTEVLLGGGGALAQDDAADAPGDAISSKSSSKGAHSKVGRRTQGHRQTGRSAAAGEKMLQGTEPELPVGVLLRVERHADLHPFQFKGMESHLLPLVPEIVVKLDPSTRVIYAQPPAGFLELGRRSLYLAFLRQALRPFVQPLLAPSVLEGKSSRGSKASAQSSSSSSSSSSGVGRDTARGSDRSNGLDRRAGWDHQGSRLSIRLGSPGDEPEEEEEEEEVVMPTRAQLEALGQQDLVRLIIKAGGFRQVAADLGYHTPNLKRPRGFLQDLEALDAEISHFIAHQWVTMDDGHNPYFYNQVTGRISRTPPSAHEDQGHRQRVLPTVGQFRAAARGDIHYAIVTHHGGYKKVAQALQRRPVKEADTAAWLSQPELLKAELMGLGKELGLAADRLPTEQQLLAAGRSDVLHAVRLSGGFPAVAKRLRMRSFRTSSRGKLKDLDTAACSLLSFSMQQLLTQQAPMRVQMQQPQQQPPQLQLPQQVPLHVQTQQEAQQQHEDGDGFHDQQEGQQALGLLAQQWEQLGVDSSMPPSLLLSRMRAKLDPLHLPFPTVQSLVNARRYDLVYALRQHDRHILAQRCGYTLDRVCYAASGRAVGYPNWAPASPAPTSRSRASGAAVREMLLSLLLGCGLPNNGCFMQAGIGKSGENRETSDGGASQGGKAHTRLGALSKRTDIGTAGADQTISGAAAPVGRLEWSPNALSSPNEDVGDPCHIMRQEWSPNALHQALLAAGVNATLATVVAQLRQLVAGGQIHRQGRGVYVAPDPEEH